MEFDNSWRGVLRPARAGGYFDPPPARPLQARREFDVSNAWWLAELSRLIYRGTPSSRDRLLAPVGLRERVFVDLVGTQCAIVEPRGEAAEPVSVLVFRGTDGPKDWRTNILVGPAAWPQGGRVHAGFRVSLEQVWPELERQLDRLEMPVFYTGHSLGGALATLAASRRRALAAYTFGAPRVGDAEFVSTLSDSPLYRVVNRRDVVVEAPPGLGRLRYADAGELRRITVPPLEHAAAAPAAAPGPGQPPLPGRRRWFDPPASLCDHAPVNYVACLERLARRLPAGRAGRWPQKRV